MMRTATRRLCGQVSTGPTEVCDQSSARTRLPISPPPVKGSAGAWGMGPLAAPP